MGTTVPSEQVMVHGCRMKASMSASSILTGTIPARPARRIAIAASSGVVARDSAICREGLALESPIRAVAADHLAVGSAPPTQVLGHLGAARRRRD
jgi:hypothetical protein